MATSVGTDGIYIKRAVTIYDIETALMVYIFRNVWIVYPAIIPIPSYTQLNIPSRIIPARHTVKHIRVSHGLLKCGNGFSLGVMYIAFTTSR